MSDVSLDLQRKLLAEAHKAAEQAYIPYSHFPVGAALWFGDDAPIVHGCNVENASYGLTMCAERTAIFKAVSEGLKGPMRVMAVIGEKARPCYPCGACLQVMREFAPELQVILEDADGEPMMLALRDLLPYSFSNQDLPAEEG